MRLRVAWLAKGPREPRGELGVLLGIGFSSYSQIEYLVESGFSEFSNLWRLFSGFPTRKVVGTWRLRNAHNST